MVGILFSSTTPSNGVVLHWGVGASIGVEPNNKPCGRNPGVNRVVGEKK